MDIKIEQADCLLFLKQIPSASVDLIVSDPPYFRFLNTAWDCQWKTESEYLTWLNNVLKEYQRVLKPTGSLYLFASERMAGKIEVLINQQFKVLNHIAWRKNSSPHNKACKEAQRKYFSQTERIIFAEQYGAEELWDKKCRQIRQQLFEPIRLYLRGAWQQSGVSAQEIEQAVGSKMCGHWFGKSQWTMPTEAAYTALQTLFGEHLSMPWHEIKSQYDALHEQERAMREDAKDHRRFFAVTKHVPHTDVWDFNPTPARAGRHPCEKPLPLIEHIISASSRPGDLVMDTFVGSGSTAVACLKLGRRFVGCEMGESEYRQAMVRIANDLSSHKCK